MTQSNSEQNYVVVANESKSLGIFFRNPFFKRCYDIYCEIESETPGSLSETLNKSSFLGIIHSLLNSKKQLQSIREFIKNDDAAGYHLNSVRSPIYFSRVKRVAKFENDELIIKSSGFHFNEEKTGGACEREFTKIYRKAGNSITKFLSFRSDKNNGYNYTYKHILIEQSLKFTGKCNDQSRVS